MSSIPQFTSMQNIINECIKMEIDRIVNDQIRTIKERYEIELNKKDKKIEELNATINELTKKNKDLNAQFSQLKLQISIMDGSDFKKKHNSINIDEDTDIEEETIDDDLFNIFDSDDNTTLCLKEIEED